MGNVPDNYSQFLAYGQQEDDTPECKSCGRSVGDELWQIDGGVYCYRCAREKLCISVDDYLDRLELEAV